MNQILVDRIGAVMIHGGLVRIECLAAGSDNKSAPSGTILIPGAQAGPVLQAIVNSLQELQKKIRETIPVGTA